MAWTTSIILSAGIHSETQNLNLNELNELFLTIKENSAHTRLDVTFKTNDGVSEKYNLFREKIKNCKGKCSG